MQLKQLLRLSKIQCEMLTYVMYITARRTMYVDTINITYLLRIFNQLAVKVRPTVR